MRGKSKQPLNCAVREASKSLLLPRCCDGKLVGEVKELVATGGLLCSPLFSVLSLVFTALSDMNSFYTTLRQPTDHHISH